ncbi:MAG: glycosyltransferase, partial [Candidatus Nanopelagicales bacterium]
MANSEGSATRADLSLVMPAFNEEDAVAQTLARVLSLPFVHEVVFVDDGSSDATLSIAREIDDARLKIIAMPRNRGKGSAVRTGIAAATGDFVAIQDADLEYDPRDLERLLGPLRDGRADVVYGSRFRAGSESRVLFYWHSLGNKLLTTLSNVTTNLNLTDMETGYKVFRREIVQSIMIEENGFGMEPEITAKVAARNLRVYEMGVSYSGRTYEEGKKIGWRDGVHALFVISKYGVTARLEVRHESLADGADEAEQALVAPLEALKESQNYNAWIADLIEPYLGASVLEVGAGQGTITSLLGARGHQVTAVEPGQRHIAAL